MEPLVSVIIPTYGRSEFLCRCIDSVLRQEYPNFEVIVVDDNEPDSMDRNATTDRLRQYDDKRLKYIKHDRNRERSAARNSGIAASLGTYVMFLDNDDEFLPGKVSAQVKYMSTHSNEFSCCYTRYIRINKHGKVTMYCAETREGSLQEEALKRNLFIHAGSNLMVRRTALERSGGFDTRISANEDIEFLARLLDNHSVGFVDHLGLVVHVDESNENTDFESILKNYIMVIKPLLDVRSNDSVERIFMFFSLQHIRFHLQKGQFGVAIKEAHDMKISTLKLVRYLIYLLLRKLRKNSYGFSG